MIRPSISPSCGSGSVLGRRWSETGQARRSSRRPQSPSSAPTLSRTCRRCRRGSPTPGSGVTGTSGAKRRDSTTSGGRVRVALAPLAQREFRLMFLGRVSSYAGSTFAIVALPFAVLELTGSTTDVGLVVASRSLPQVVFMLVGGIWADRLPRHALMVGTNVVSAIAQGATAALLLTGNAEIWQLAALQALGGTATAFFFPASTGLVPQTVPATQLQEANALLRLALNVAQISSAAAAGFVVAGIGPGWAIAVDAASFVVGAVFLAGMHLPRGQRIEAPNFLKELALGWREFRSRTWLWVIVVAFAFLNATEVGGVNVLGP